MFIKKEKYPNKLEYVNLKSVSYINVTEDSIILNMCFSYEDKHYRHISHQHFLSIDNQDFMKTDYFKENFIEIRGDDRIVFANKNYIASIIADTSQDPEQNKVIVCFTNAVTKTPSAKLMPEYLYIRMSGYNVNLVVEDIVSELNTLG